MTSPKRWMLLSLMVMSVSVSLAQADSLYTTAFVIRSLPGSTPKDASLFISGEFCSWYPDVKDYQFRRHEDGTYYVEVPHNRSMFQYKITRGSWDAVEARANGRALPNRKYEADGREDVVYLDVKAWEDISVGSYNLHMYVMILCAVQALLLMIAINTLKKRNKVANSTLGLMLLLITVSLLGRAGSFNPEVFNWQPKLILIPEVLLFLFGPIVLLYIHQLLRIPRKSYFWIYFIPVIILIFFLFPYYKLDNQTFTYRVIDQELKPVYAIAGVSAFFFNLYFWFRSRVLVNKYRQGELNDKQQKYSNFLNAILLILGSYLVLWFGIIAVYLLDSVINDNLYPMVEQLTDVLWLLFSFIVFALGYFSIKNPEILLFNKKYKDANLEEAEVDSVLERLTELLDKEHVYRNSELTLADLANMIPTSSHALSRVINEHYNQTFTALINKKRVDDFVKKIAEEPKASFLSIAMEVGFNSKATFNRAFKKTFGESPSEYFKTRLKTG